MFAFNVYSLDLMFSLYVADVTNEEERRLWGLFFPNCVGSKRCRQIFKYYSIIGEKGIASHEFRYFFYFIIVQNTVTSSQQRPLMFVQQRASSVGVVWIMFYCLNLILFTEWIFSCLS